MLVFFQIFFITARSSSLACSKFPESKKAKRGMWTWHGQALLLSPELLSPELKAQSSLLPLAMLLGSWIALLIELSPWGLHSECIFSSYMQKYLPNPRNWKTHHRGTVMFHLESKNYPLLPQCPAPDRTCAPP